MSPIVTLLMIASLVLVGFVVIAKAFYSKFKQRKQTPDVGPTPERVIEVENKHEEIIIKANDDPTPGPRKVMAVEKRPARRLSDRYKQA